MIELITRLQREKNIAIGFICQDLEDLHKVMAEYTPGATLEDLRKLAEAYTYEDAVARRA